MTKYDDDEIIAKSEKVITNENETPAMRAEACVEKFQYLVQEYKLCPKLLEKALEWQPNMPAALTQMGVFYRLTGNNEKAREYLDTAVQIAPSYAPARLERGKFYKGRGEKEKAEADYNTYLQLNTTDPSIYAENGFEIYNAIRKNIMNKKGSKNSIKDFDTAIFYYSEAINRNPSEPGYFERRGELYLCRELRFGGAEYFINACSDIEKFLTISQDQNMTRTETIFCNMFSTISQKNKKRYFSKMINDLPYGSDAYWMVFKNLAEALIDEKGSVRALNLYATMIERNNTGSVWQLFGYAGRSELYIRQKESDKALNDYAAIIQLAKEDEPEKRRIDIEPSYAHWRRADIYKDCSRLNTKMNYTEKIITEYSEIINMEKVDIFDRYTAHLKRAEIYKEQGEYEKALVDYSAIIEGSDSDYFVKDAYKERMNIYLKNGDKEKAFHDFIKMTESRDGFEDEGLDVLDYEILSDEC
jgi:tetratricopeptide (TPR) repeat protein